MPADIMTEYAPLAQMILIAGVMFCLIMAQIYQRKQRRVVDDLLREHTKLRSECEKIGFCLHEWSYHLERVTLAE